jgi:CRISPR-associated endoribonuclease Cas6
MRLCISLRSEKPEQRVPLSHLDLVRGWVSALRPVDDRSLTYSDLRVPTTQRTIDTATCELCIRPGVVQWWLASPDDALLTRLTTRISKGEEWQIANARFRVAEVDLHAFPDTLVTSEESVDLRFTCWTPIVANGVPGTETVTEKARREYEAQIRRSLVDKYVRVHRAHPRNDRIGFQFDSEYLARHPRGGAKRISWRGRAVSGVLAPFTLTASPELLRIAWECGIGDRADKGFGFAEIVR